MPRPRKCRRICALPRTVGFCPAVRDVLHADKSNLEKPQVVFMSLDEFETIRLIDYEGLLQEDCAQLMNIARTTVQAIYNSARTKIADCLVNGKDLKIQGGDYEVCNKNISGDCSCNCPHSGSRCKFT